jgi:hypothetical protein
LAPPTVAFPLPFFFLRVNTEQQSCAKMQGDGREGTENAANLSKLWCTI